jgi:methyl-accepting chemotaxis protein
MFNPDTAAPFDYQSEFHARLSGAHAKIEKTFLEGGEVLVSVMEMVNSLIAILDRMTNSLNAEASQNTTDTLNRSIEELAKLPETETIRQSGFETLSNMCGKTTGHIADISETIRYLKTFVITVKIAGAGLSELTGFADEIRERIQHGADEVALFAKNLEAMRGQLARARGLSANTQSGFGDQIPSLIGGLSKNAGLIQKQNAEMAAIAGEVRKIAQTIQMKIASVLSALQIGDITRQRIEHIQSTLQLLEEFTTTEEGLALSDSQTTALRDVVAQLCHAQMVETSADFQRDCSRILSSITSFTEDAAQILALRDELVEKLMSGDSNIYHQMEVGITEACALSQQVQNSSSEADRVVRSVTQNAQELLRGIAVLRAIKTEIHYMALNSNLHCSKLGERGKSVAVVSGEMRIFAAKLEEPADAIVAELTTVEDTTRMLAEKSDGLSTELAAPLGEVLRTITNAKDQINLGVDALAEEGQQVFSRIGSAVIKLDFESELGDTFNDCCEISAKLSHGTASDVSEFAETFDSLNHKIYRLYTMAQERDIHLAYLPAPAVVAVQQAASTASAEDSAPKASTEDEDLFDDALF